MKNKFREKLEKKYDVVYLTRFEIWKDDDTFLSNYPNHRLKWRKFTGLYDDYYYHQMEKGVKCFSTLEEAEKYVQRKSYEEYQIKAHYLCQNLCSNKEGDTHWREGCTQWENVQSI